MFELLAPPKGNVIGFRALGRLTDADYKAFLPTLEELIRKYGRARVLVDIRELKGWDVRAAWDDFVFGVKYWNSFERLGVVGRGATWEKWAARILNRLMKGEVRYFAADEMDVAWDWLQHNNQSLQNKPKE